MELWVGRGIGEYRAAGRAGGKAVRFVVRRDHPMPRAALEAVAGELAHYKGPPDRPEAVRLPTRHVVPIDAAFLADLRPLAPGSDLLVPAVLLDLYPTRPWRQPSSNATIAVKL